MRAIILVAGKGSRLPKKYSKLPKSFLKLNNKKLIDILKEGIVEITFRSLKSNKTHKREYTTHKSFMPSLKNQSASDKILCYDVEFEKVEDIDVSTIEKYVPLQRLS